MPEVYDPKEDSYLLAAAVEKYARGKVLDMGTGSGIQAVTAAKMKEVVSVVAADVNEEALKSAAAAAEKAGVIRKIAFVKTSLFASIKGKFDTIIFNPPYLPQDRGIVDEAIYGGKKGHELAARFINESGRHLESRGIILLLFSTLTGKQKIDEAVEKNCLQSEEVGQKRLSFETLYTYLIRKTRLLEELEEKGVAGASLFAKGNRGVIYKAEYKGRAIAVKAKKEGTAAVATIENEAEWLRILNKDGIGPKLLMAGEGWLAYEFVEGDFLPGYLEGCSKNEAVSAIRQMLEQARKMDELGVNKGEMLRPQKHAIVGSRGKVTMLDFERCRRATAPKNVTQLCQFLASGRLLSLLGRKEVKVAREDILAAAKAYKSSQTGESFKRILDLLS